MGRTFVTAVGALALALSLSFSTVATARDECPIQVYHYDENEELAEGHKDVIRALCEAGAASERGPSADAHCSSPRRAFESRSCCSRR